LLVLECFVVFLFGLGLFACFCSGGSQHVKVKVDCRCNSARAWGMRSLACTSHVEHPRYCADQLSHYSHIAITNASRRMSATYL
jgi:hypothetical protein